MERLSSGGASHPGSTKPARARPKVLVLYTLDRIDELNELHGPRIGDAVLELFRRRVEARFPEGRHDRWLGARYSIWLDSGDVTKSEVRERLTAEQDSLAHGIARLSDRALVVSLSAGMTESWTDDVASAYQRAARALGQARREGGGRILDLGDRVGARGTVLLAEDDEMTARLVTRFLSLEGVQVQHFADGRRALEWAGQADASLVVVDAKMPYLDGFELVRSLRRLPRYRQTRIVMLTSLNREADVLRGFEMGVDDYLQKPFSPKELRVRLLKWLPSGPPGFQEGGA